MSFIYPIQKMRIPRPFLGVPFRLTCLLSLAALSAHGTMVYENHFDSSADLTDFTVFGESFTGYTPPPLHQISVQNGELIIDTQSLSPNGAGTAPTLFGRASLMVGAGQFDPLFKTTLSNNPGLVTWGFNVANQDGAFNNGFEITLASTMADPFLIAADGYALKGGGSVGNRLYLTRFDFGLGGGQQLLIDLAQGLAPLPQHGSFRVTFDPKTGRWSLYGEFDEDFVDPLTVTSLLGTAIDSTYTKVPTPYMGIGGGTTGRDIFDNLSVQVVPEPSAALFVIGAGSICVTSRFRRRTPALRSW